MSERLLEATRLRHRAMTREHAPHVFHLGLELCGLVEQGLSLSLDLFGQPHDELGKTHAGIRGDELVQVPGVVGQDPGQPLERGVARSGDLLFEELGRQPDAAHGDPSRPPLFTGAVDHLIKPFSGKPVRELTRRFTHAGDVASISTVS